MARILRTALKKFAPSLRRRLVNARKKRVERQIKTRKAYYVNPETRTIRGITVREIIGGLSDKVGRLARIIAEGEYERPWSAYSPLSVWLGGDSLREYQRSTVKQRRKFLQRETKKLNRMIAAYRKLERISDAKEWERTVTAMLLRFQK